MEKIWEDICREVAGMVDEGHFKVWIANLKAVCSVNELKIFARNDFVARFVKGHFRSIFATAAERVLGAVPEICITSEAAPDQAHTCSISLAEFSRKNAPRPESLRAFSETGHTATLAAPDAGAATISDFPQSGPVSDDLRQQGAAGNSFSTYAGPRTSENALGATSISPSVSSAPTAIVYSSRNESESMYQTRGQQDLPLRWDTGSRQNRNWRFTFNDFVVGPSNELAHAAARNISGITSGQRSIADMLYLCSSPGLGKTHLLQSVGSALFKSCNFASPRIEYVTAEEFATQMRMALRSGEIERFKARFRLADLLLLEDVHFLQEKDKTQQELLSTISALLDRGSKVVLSSSFAPRELRNMDDQLLSRFSSGLVAGIERPDREMRKRIISCKAVTHNVSISDDVAEYLAENIESDVRQIESCLQTLALKAQLLNSCISLDMAIETLAKCAMPATRLTLNSIIRMVCEGFGISSDQLNSKSRKQQYVIARNAVFYLARKHTELSLQAIGKHFNRTHSTVIKGITTLERELTRNSSSGRQIANAIQMIEKRGQISHTL